MEPIMLVSLFLIPFLICFSTLYFLFIFSSSKNKSTVDPSKYPPGNTGWPVIGETLDFIDVQKFIQERMNKTFKRYLQNFNGNKFLFSKENKLVASWMPHSIQKLLPFTSKTSVDDETRKIRKVLSQFLMPGSRQRCISIIDRVVMQQLVTNWDNKRKVTVAPLTKNYSLCLACEPLDRIKDAIFSFPIDLSGTAYNLGIKSTKLVLNKIEKQSFTYTDILSHMLLEVDDDGNLIDESDIASKILGLFIGIDNTSGIVITFMIKYLAELPGVYSEVQKEIFEIESSKGPGESLNWDDIQKIKYTWNVAIVLTRLVPPCQGTFREAIADFNYKGYSVPKGWKLFWSQHSTHMNSDYFSEPEKFDPTRFEGKGPAPCTYVAFGGGPHICPGKDIAKLQILVFIYHVVRKYKWESVLLDEKVVLYPFPRPVDGLPVLLQPRIVLSKELGLY
ncbi:hypothetical protein MKW92_032652 [Papaver armeniacum]|nr:hypothetical protein MKW92_032652 [Papaver armeniacum]